MKTALIFFIQTKKNNDTWMEFRTTLVNNWVRKTGFSLKILT